MITKTLSPENQFRFDCPIFHTETRIASCLALRDAVYRGDKPQVRVGCQVAMTAGKCPIPTVVTRMVREKNDPYYAATPTKGKLNIEVIDKHAPVLVLESVMKRYPLSAAEEKLLHEANEYAKSGKHKPHQKPRRVERVMEDVEQPAPPAAKTDASEMLKAAQTGDMTAAINAEVK